MDYKAKSKKWAQAAILSVMLASMATPSYAGDAISVHINGVPMQFDVPATVIDGRTMVPLRGIFEALGAEISWHDDTMTVEATRGEQHITLPVGSKQAIIKGQLRDLDVPAMLMEGRTMVPARFVAESLGCNVAWDNATRTVLITTDDGAPYNYEPQPSTIDDVPAVGEAPLVDESPVTQEASGGGDAATLELIAQLQQTLAIYPDMAGSIAFNIAMMQFKIGNFDEGIQNVFLAAQARPKLAYNTLSSGAQALFNLGQTERGNQVLDEAMSIDPENQMIYQMMKK
ncbi:copper amine oxidase N-terminal domain-containing protein [Heliophilum fasciatum]|uniref:Copper amine oxidase-like protein n=1 Tax=Heliophilum fasciatum TaxID=35700 RepID=A0A4V2SWW5_9FIRM|nr:stalk domain-containing protein [Heliophilum fasciatum]MCW2278203.1 hypothetical protein [Heliophilum fasciatum]TCP63976.1 copper amine oxidase-like protein [Heliophilum fasciatum]